MALNCGYIKSLVSILKLASIALLLIAYSIGMHAYLSSEYNKGCMNPTPSPFPTRTPPPPPPPTFSASSVTPTTTSQQITSSRSTTEKFIVSLDPQPISSTTTSRTTTPTPNKTGCDMAPILWMERFHLIVTGICVLLSVIMLLLHLVKADLLENPNFKGVDFGYHFFGAIWLIVSAIFMMYSASKIDNLASELCFSDPDNCQLMKEKMTAAAFALLAGIVFIAVAIKNFGKKFYQPV